ncbi:organic cation transporter protein-like [Oppia nitens]|uniref:organic cation transporter protein-like n=1 Tax=Oppia nitens TaxID=1686743 RepID=UPI0023DC77DE|nr:organic cation transporter protein-like [Oppia nitens]
MKQQTVRHVLTDIIGEWGLWQLNIVVFAISLHIFMAINSLSVAFYAPTIKYWCADNNNNTIIGDVVNNQFHLICDRQGLASLSQSLYMFGRALGGVIFGCLSDRFGRIPILGLTLLLEIMAGLSSALAINILQFTIARTVLGFVANGRYLCTIMLVTECLDSKYRVHLGIVLSFGLSMGYCLLPGIAYLLPNFRHMILATIIPEFVWLLWLLWIPESPRWLIANRQWNRLERLVRQAVQMNSVSINDWQNQIKLLISQQNNENKRSYIWDVLKSPNLRRTTLIMFFTWFVNAFVYYGISLNIGDFGGNLFINFLVAGLIEFPSILLALVALKYIGRRPLVAGLMYASGLSCLAVIPFISTTTTTTTTTVWPRITIALIGKFFIGCSFNIIYPYTAEVYPTVVRQVGVATCSVAARVGSMIAPFVKELNVYTGMSVVLTIFGSLSIADGVSVHFLPETRGQQIADTIDEAEQLNSYR